MPLPNLRRPLQETLRHPQHDADIEPRAQDARVYASVDVKGRGAKFLPRAQSGAEYALWWGLLASWWGVHF